ncbi:TH1-like protein [Chloropicon primus]|uniref:TH1-like protein n=1 Tax=Chloropicon primus TaxID=1764295 RepID=A0A5B8MGA1_9CHLO|nr:TH1-like protein [Chloropicon primus]UPQ98910.1 TH1-like protein [Chloropicon primus]|mmetsp:Transcript_4154/g.12103  ORF Transcript_4154/g.12103 Transcript_4154/m.12103 type:complete len:594 (-) Transcript_4154:1431-3212(-)|eukprot:QDZ19698.1 TH1-like protein [Chloropicon primus]
MATTTKGEEEGGGMEVEHGDRMGQLENVFQQKDAITEPEVLDTIKQYVAVGGKPQTVVEMLSESYVGYGAMINVILEWINTFDLLKGSNEMKREEKDCLWKFLSQFVRENFDPAAFSDVFSSGGGFPEWLQGLIEFPEGRELIYELTDQHRNCLFLNFAVHHILLQGFDKEVAAVGGSISGNFNVFNRLFIKKVEELYASPDDEKDFIRNQLFQMCCSDETKYAYSKLILSKAFDMPYGGYFKRLAEQLEVYAGKNAGLTAWKMNSLFLSKSGYNSKNLEAAFCIGSILRSSSTVLGEVQKLLRMYKQEDGRPSLELLRNSQLMEKMLSDLFAPIRKITDQHRIHIVDIIKEVVAHNSDTDVESISSAISEAVACTQSVSSGVKLAEINLDFLDVPVASIGIYQWLKMKLVDSEFLESGNSIFPSLIQLLHEILERQPLQRSDVLNMISDTLPHIGNSLHTLSRQMLDAATVVLVHGDVALFSSFSKNLVTQRVDRSLIRHLVRTVLSMVGPPYSAFFASTVLRLVTASGHDKITTERGRKSSPDKQSDKHSMPIVSFLAACESIEFAPNSLGPEEESLLAGIRNKSSDHPLE